MSVKGLMRTFGQGITKTMTVMEACRVMHAQKVGALAIEDGAKLCGIFTYRDLVERVILEKRDPEKTTLGDVMTSDVDALAADKSYGEALHMMVDNDYTYVPVIGGDGELRGMLSLRALLEHEIDHLADELDSVTQYLAVDGPGGD